MRFNNKTVLVTGSSSGIGAATVIAFAKERANVVIVGRNEKKLNKVQEKCESFGKKPLVLKADVTVDAKRIIDETIAKFGKLDVLVNNAGILDFTDITEDSFMEQYHRIMNTNLNAVVYMTHLAIPHLVKTKGNIINISSIAATSCVGAPDLVSYCVSKAGLNHFSRTLALKLSEHGVRVNVISPGPVRTDIQENSSKPLGSWDVLAEKTPLKRVSEPEEIADMILFLASDKAKAITGSEFISDNGILLNNTII